MELKYLKLEECVKGKIYKLHSRNLSVGVFDGDRGFIGLRTKFNSRFLATEYHWDHPPFATARPLQDLDISLPDDIPIKERLETIDQRNNREVEFDRPVSEGGRGWYYKDTNEPDQDIKPITLSNSKLYYFLKKLEEPFSD